MNIRTRPITPARQRGAAVILTVLVLLLGMTIIALTASRSGMFEQKIAGNDIRAREVQEAAEAGISYAISWGGKNIIADSMNCPGDAACPNLATINGSTSGETYQISRLNFIKGPEFIEVQVTAQGVSDPTILATSTAFMQQKPRVLFEPDAITPPPWVIAGCLTTAPTGTPNVFVLNGGNVAVSSGTAATAACLPQGNLDLNVWTDTNQNGAYDGGGEKGAVIPFNRATFTGCPALHCAWNRQFSMPLVDADPTVTTATSLATAAGQVYNGTIPCGASGSPAIYIINNGGPINSASISNDCGSPMIGAPGKPILLIVPAAAGCPQFNGGVTIYGIVYYETTTACAANGWGGATVYGSVIWEGSVDKPNANTLFIEGSFGNFGQQLDQTFQMDIINASRLPGTWKDF